VTHATLDDIGESFFARQTILRRWLPIATSTTTIWLAITVLGLVAAVMRRRRYRTELARMAEREEMTVTATGEEDVHSDDLPVN
jgi:CHASE1-domain containing sensor protein